jgi:hypothetical protein
LIAAFVTELWSKQTLTMELVGFAFSVTVALVIDMYSQIPVAGLEMFSEKLVLFPLNFSHP